MASRSRRWRRRDADATPTRRLSRDHNDGVTAAWHRIDAIDATTSSSPPRNRPDAVRTASNSKKKPSATLSDGYDAHRWLEGAAAPRDAAADRARPPSCGPAAGLAAPSRRSTRSVSRILVHYIFPYILCPCMHRAAHHSCLLKFHALLNRSSK